MAKKSTHEGQAPKATAPEQPASAPVLNPAAQGGTISSADLSRVARSTPQGAEQGQSRATYVVPAVERRARTTGEEIEVKLPDVPPDPGGISQSDQQEFERKRRYREEVQMRHRMLTVVRFVSDYRNYNAGDVAGLLPEEATVAITQGFATYAGGAKPSLGALDAGENARERETNRVKMQHLRRYIANMPKDDASFWDKERKPKREKLEQLLGMPVSDEERDAAWEAHVNEAEARRRDLAHAAEGAGQFQS